MLIEKVLFLTQFARWTIKILTSFSKRNFPFYFTSVSKVRIIGFWRRSKPTKLFSARLYI